MVSRSARSAEFLDPYRRLLHDRHRRTPLMEGGGEIGAWDTPGIVSSR